MHVHTDAHGFVVAFGIRVVAASWTGHQRGTYDPMATLERPFSGIDAGSLSADDHRTSLQHHAELGAPKGPARHASWTGTESSMRDCAADAIVALGHAAGCTSAVLMFQSGAAALCLAEPQEPSTLLTLQHSHWLICPEGSQAAGTHPAGGTDASAQAAAPSSPATSCAVSARAASAALGCADGTVWLWHTAGAAGAAPHAVLSLADWGYGPADTRAVAHMDWTADGEVRC